LKKLLKLKNKKVSSEELFELDLPNLGPCISKQTIIFCLIMAGFSIWSFSRSIWIAFYYQILILTNISLSVFLHRKRKKIFESYMLLKILETPVSIKKKYNSFILTFVYPSEKLLKKVQKSEFK